jgi:hypothetical protein
MYQNHFRYLLLLFFCFHSNFIFSLHRDDYTLVFVDEESSYECYCVLENEDLCLNCLENILHCIPLDDFPIKPDMIKILKNYRYLIPQNRSSGALSYSQRSRFCGLSYDVCNKEKFIYKGYFDPTRSRYFDQFQRYLEFISYTPNCTYFWPEISDKAAEINDMAYELFYNLFNDTELHCICTPWYNDEDFSDSIIVNCSGVYDLFNIEDLCVMCVNHSFFFSDYSRVCQDIYDYSLRNYSKSDCQIILENLHQILDELAPYFLELYEDCLDEFPDEFINRELFIIETQMEWCSTNIKKIQSYLEVNQTDDIFCLDSNANFMRPSIKPAPINSTLESDFWLAKGVLFNNCMLYSDAIEALTESIKSNLKNREAYIERAFSYFETNQIHLALKDYKKATELIFVAPLKPMDSSLVLAKFYIPENKLEFSSGLIKGSLEGMKVSSVEFIPTFYSSCRGLSNGLWAFVCAPIDVSQDLIMAAYSIGEFISSHSYQECLECVVPEIRELSLSWNRLNDHSRGHHIGYIIGKYGLDVFIPVASIKIASKVCYLKRANTMLTLESCAASEAKHATILKESAKRGLIKTSIIESAKPGKILIKTPNVQYHVMQKKHAWDKVIKLSGNVEEDFKNVILLLENENLINKNFMQALPKHFPKDNPKIIRSDHKKFINQHEVYTVFETYIESGEVYLKDAWVIIQ